MQPLNVKRLTTDGLTVHVHVQCAYMYTSTVCLHEVIVGPRVLVTEHDVISECRHNGSQSDLPYPDCTSQWWIKMIKWRGGEALHGNHTVLMGTPYYDTKV